MRAPGQQRRTLVDANGRGPTRAQLLATARWRMPSRLRSKAMKVVARFDPPGAHDDARQWREQHAALLSELPDEAVRIDTGRAVGGGDFVQISVTDEYASRFPDD
jgi:hypothetical protein